MIRIKSKKKVRQFQEFLMNSWPAKHYYFLNGWVLRFTVGVTSRANSVFPVGYTGAQKDLGSDIDLVEKAYNVHKLPPVFTIPEFHEPKNLKAKLLERGYHTYDHTSALGIKIEDLQNESINEDFEYYIFGSRNEEISGFLAKFSKRNEEEQRIIQEINQRILIPKKCYMLTKCKNVIIGTLLAVLVPQGYMYIGDVFVHPNYRRQRVASSMLVKLIDKWAIKEAVKNIWLQVEINNKKALNLYYKIAMRKLYNYFYMKRDQ
ncbi:MAG: GNAT family N-acetyltransferase [Candidatus Lokiarchaeota archaeon]|nr:GNAT family N-acetyltransferase [Candidatus Lokiarchaeota archaeon]